MDQEQLRKAYSEDAKLEYLFDDDQWLSAIISSFKDSSSSHSPNITIT